MILMSKDATFSFIKPKECALPIWWLLTTKLNIFRVAVQIKIVLVLLRVVSQRCVSISYHLIVSCAMFLAVEMEPSAKLQISGENGSFHVL